MKNILLIPALATSLLLPPALFATGVDAAFDQYRAAGGADFSAAAGETLWLREVPSAKENQLLSCGSCHTNNLIRSGTHHKTGKSIEPMALAANPSRYSELKKIEKWFKRNCKWAWGRECSPQEKGDILTYLINYK